MGISNKFTQLRQPTTQSDSVIPPKLGILLMAIITVTIASLIGTVALAMP